MSVIIIFMLCASILLLFLSMVEQRSQITSFSCLGILVNSWMCIHHRYQMTTLYFQGLPASGGGGTFGTPTFGAVDTNTPT